LTAICGYWEDLEDALVDFACGPFALDWNIRIVDLEARGNHRDIGSDPDATPR
jgi:hypothetical protein